MPSTASSCPGSFLAGASRASVHTARRSRFHSLLTPTVLNSVDVELSKCVRCAASITASLQFSALIAVAASRYQKPE